MEIIISIFNFEFGDRYFNETADSANFLHLLYKAFIAAIPSIIVFYLGYIFTKNKEHRKEQKGHKIVIQNVYAHCLNIELSIPRIISNLNTYLNEKEEDLLEEQVFPWLNLPDLDRISKLPVDKTFEAFKDIKTDNIFLGTESFRSIFNSTSHLTSALQRIELIHKELANDRYNLSSQFKSLVGEIRDKIAIESKQNSDEQIRNEFNHNLIEYLNLIEPNKPLPYSYHEKELIDRFIEICLPLYQKTNDANIREILGLLKETKNTIDDLRFKSREEIENLKTLADALTSIKNVLNVANSSIRNARIV